MNVEKNRKKLRELLQNVDMPLFIMMMGLPRSGKSTFARAILRDETLGYGAALVNPDSFRLTLHGKAFVQQAEGIVWASVFWAIQALYQAGHEVIIYDATNTTRARREEAFRAAGARSQYVVNFSAVSLEVCCDRALREGRPDLLDVIRGMHSGWEPVETREAYEYHIDVS